MSNLSDIDFFFYSSFAEKAKRPPPIGSHMERLEEDSLNDKSAHRQLGLYMRDLGKVHIPSLPPPIG
ncbi:3304_t:CDS:2, partial [Acaulospora colombiana]